MGSLSEETLKEHETCTHVYGYLTSKTTDPNEQLEYVLKVMSFILITSIPKGDDIEFDLTFNRLINRMYYIKEVAVKFRLMAEKFGVEGLAGGLAEIVKAMAEGGRKI